MPHDRFDAVAARALAEDIAESTAFDAWPAQLRTGHWIVCVAAAHTLTILRVFERAGEHAAWVAAGEHQWPDAGAARAGIATPAPLARLTDEQQARLDAILSGRGDDDPPGDGAIANLAADYRRAFYHGTPQAR